MTQQPNPQQPYKGLGLEDVRKVLDSKLVNTGVPGVIAGFGVSRAFEGEWWQFVSLLGAATGVWFSIKLGNRFAPKVERVLDRADQAFDRRVDLALVSRSKFHQQYLEALKTHCYNLKVEGYKGRLPRLVLDKVYVPLKVNTVNALNRATRNQPLKIWDLLPKVHHDPAKFPERLLAVIANPGYGKTTLMRFLTLSFASQSYRAHNARELIPILLLFREFYPRIQSRNEPALTQLIVETVQKLPRCAELRTSEPWFDDQLRQGKCLVMLDGLDEVPDAQREQVSQWANWQMQNYPSQFVLTSRPHGYDSSLFEGVQRIDILDFNNDQKRTFIEQWYRFITWELTWKHHWEDSQQAPDPSKRLTRSQAEAESEAEAQTAADDLKRQLFGDRRYIDLAKNPLLITIIAATHEASEQLPKRRVQLYKEIFKLLLEYRPNRRDTRLTIANAEDNQLILQCLAMELTEADKTQFLPEQGAEWIQQRLREVYPDESLTPKAFLREIQQVSGLLAGGEGNLYEFTHKTFQEFLAAMELSASRWGQRQMMEHFTNESWEEVIIFYASLTDQPVPFIEKALEDPANTYTLDLAKRLVEALPFIGDSYKQAILAAKHQQAAALPQDRLEWRFQNLMPLSEHTAISEPITWGEYQLFIESQLDQEFHSWANAEHLAVVSYFPYEPLDDVAWEDARWFCAWLATQAQLAPNEGVYDYRLPTPKELAVIGVESRAPSPTPIQPWSSDPDRFGNCLRIVRQQIPNRYRELVNYLASGSWKEADEETDKLLLKAVGKEDVTRELLRLEEIQNFPCKDLLLIDHLWTKFSGGKFGFISQKQIWQEAGGTLDLDGNEQMMISAFKEMSQLNGWRENNDDIPYSQVIFDISAPIGHLPLFCGVGYCFDGWGAGGIDGMVSIFSRLRDCMV
ncbi:MAG: NACHT domain-containing protein [Leptolyngbya sp. SIOISBB]|nr:NACHT domain-containing protein [Leptolyngbya sp. SIOISBB]